MILTCCARAREVKFQNGYISETFWNNPINMVRKFFRSSSAIDW